jgi:dinuclear metal center YbgI/SA1388 family protein
VMSPVRVHEIVALVNEIAPFDGAEPWDNVGLLLGSQDDEVEAIHVTLDPTLAAIAEARRLGANVLLAHHPLMMTGLAKVVSGDAVGGRLMAAAREGLSVIAAHTNADAVPELATAALARAFGLTDTRPLLASSCAASYKLVVFVPPAAADEVARALAGAGAGAIGDYRECTFRSPGIGTFRPIEGASPTIGEIGQLERVEEVRLETIVPAARLGAAVSAMIEAHPYEEVAYDVYRLETGPKRGFGCVGKLGEPAPLGDVAGVCERVFGTPPFLPAGPQDASRQVSRLAVMPGSASAAAAASADAGADVLVCGEMKYHEALDAAARGVSVVAVGHAASELPLVGALGSALRAAVEGRGWATPVLVDEAGKRALAAAEGIR